MNESNLMRFKYESRQFLAQFSHSSLRAYARKIGVDVPTKKNKDTLVEEIVAVLSGELEAVAPSKRGAPVKNDYFDPKISVGIERLKVSYLGGQAIPAETKGKGPQYNVLEMFNELGNKEENVFRVQDPNAPKFDLEKQFDYTIYRGQLVTLNEVSLLLPLNCMDSAEKIIISNELKQEFSLRDGDLISCHAQKSSSVLVAKDILTINDLVVGSFTRRDFEEEDVCFPKEKFNFIRNEEECSVTAKYMQWLLPIAKGQRGCVSASPKMGKTGFLFEAIQAFSKSPDNPTVLTLLIDQSPEVVSRFRKICDKENFVYTTYDDDPDRQVFVADFILKRAKRLAESGRDVVLIVDSFNALARAYNDTDESSGGKTLVGGLESKTVHYLKKYLGAARCFEKGGSLMILGAVSVGTGNPVDEVIYSELSTISNLEIVLSDSLALKRIYPAIDFQATRAQEWDCLMEEDRKQVERYLREVYLPKHGEEQFIKTISSSRNYEQFIKRLKTE